MSAYDEQALAALRGEMRRALSEKRFAHTLGVEETAARMAALYCPKQTALLRAAALLHDCTKEYTAAQTAAVLAREGICLREDEQASPKIWHAITAPPEIRRRYPAFADPALLSAVRWHTTGRAGMTICDAVLYLADVIEAGRTYPACVALRRRFFEADFAHMSAPEREAHLIATLLCSLTGVRDSLAAENAPVCGDTLAAIADLQQRKTF